MKAELEKLRSYYQKLELSKRPEFIRGLSHDELLTLFDNPRFFLYDKQIPPDTNWRYHWFRGGRGTGKSFASTSWLYEKIIGGARECAIVGPSFGDLTKETLPVFESHFPRDKKPKYNGQYHYYTCFNNCIVKVYSSDTEIRGLNAEFGIAEEMAKWCDSIPEKIQECFNIFELGCRSRRARPNPQIFISTTPKPFPFFVKFEKEALSGNPDYSMTMARTSDNIFLSSAAIKSFYDNTPARQQRQELEAELLTDNPNALWTAEVIDKCKISSQIFDQMLKDNVISIVRTVVTLDPAVSTNPNSDETGLFASALCSDNKVYILEDSSGKMTPEKWSAKAVAMYHHYNAFKIVMESNQGGALLEQAVKTVDRNVRVELIHASVGKKTRFEPVVMAYERGEVFHVGNMTTLENQMLGFNPLAPGGQSPDRADAVAYAVYYLLLGQENIPRRSSKNFGNW